VAAALFKVFVECTADRRGQHRCLYSAVAPGNDSSDGHLRSLFGADNEPISFGSGALYIQDICCVNPGN
jgi:hypothetical protein